MGCGLFLVYLHYNCRTGCRCSRSQKAIVFQLDHAHAGRRCFLRRRVAQQNLLRTCMEGSDDAAHKKLLIVAGVQQAARVSIAVVDIADHTS